MLLDSIEHAEEDIQPRQLREQQVEAERDPHDARKQLGEHGDLLARRRARAIEAAMARVAELPRSATDSHALADAIKALDERLAAVRRADHEPGDADPARGRRVEDV